MLSLLLYLVAGMVKDGSDLYSAAPILAFEIISGNFICKNDPAKTAELFSLICCKYEEAMCCLNYVFLSPRFPLLSRLAPLIMTTLNVDIRNKQICLC